MTNAALTQAPTLRVDVYPDQPSDLRRRLRDRAQASFVSLLPGGMMLSESEEAHTYCLAGAGGWSSVGGDALRFESAEGHVLELREGRLVLTIAK